MFVSQASVLLSSSLASHTCTFCNSVEQTDDEFPQHTRSSSDTHL